MATKSTEKNEVVEPVAMEQVYTLDELKQNAPVLFGVQSEVLAGALHGNTKSEFTINEMKGLVDKFLKRKVK